MLRATVENMQKKLVVIKCKKNNLSVKDELKL